MLRRILLLLIIISPTILYSQDGENAAEIRQQIKKLRVLGTVLYLAAHPDDENTRIISYLANGRLYETAYFSLTRGDGGQNLIGDEKGDLLGVIRTQELLQARNIDGGQQFFSNSVDFGYTRSKEETYQKWRIDSVLIDAVWVIRTFKPDVIILRFPTDGRGGHGHHTASAEIALMAAEYASSPMDIFTEPVSSKQTRPWVPKRIFVNTGKWWVPNIDSTAAANPGKYLKLDVGGYNGLLGLSYTEIAGMSRSQHKTQGFGASLKKGETFEYLELAFGDSAYSDIMDGIDTDWTRLGDYNHLNLMIDSILLNFDDEEPWNSVDYLFTIRDKISEVTDEHWKKIKIQDINQIIQSCLGLVFEAISPQEKWVPGTTRDITFKVLNRSSVKVNLNKISGIDSEFEINTEITDNKWFEIQKVILLPDSTPLSDPYWLREKHSDRFIISDRSIKATPEVTDAPLYIVYLSINNNLLSITKPVIYKHVDRVKGELIHPVFIAPALSIHPESKSAVFRLSQKRSLRFQVTSVADSGKMDFYPNLPDRWQGPEKIEFKIDHAGQQLWINVEITAPDTLSVVTISPVVKSGNKIYSRDQIIIDYDHIEPKMLTPLAELKLVSTDLNTIGLSVAYLAGAGDEIPQIMEQLGYHVTLIKPEDLKENLNGYDALIFGVRAYNVYPELNNYHQELMQYVEGGGNIVMQYNTSRGLDAQFGPYPFKLSRERITDENAQVQILNPTDSILIYPNQIKETDFDNWVQERGLYFTEQWDSNYRAPIAFDNPEGKQLAGGLLVTSYGKGTYVYTSLAFFRELPAGVPGAYRLFANLVAGGKENNSLIPEEKEIIPLEKQ
jgi:LmbE family N-acetylglucosaminyl deacetylase